MPLDLGAPGSPTRRAFLEEGPWQTCPLCAEQSGSWEWLEEHILSCEGDETVDGPARWRGRWCPACGDDLDDAHDSDICIEERAAS
ncbi:MAG: hypothetical protein HY689_01170 [Chloroflexi bacterium]|nr:hypothetical protein [Chloroflexota bacterium]